MAFNKFDVPAASVALTATTPLSVVGLKASTNVAILITEVMVSFDGATSTNAPAVVEFMRATFATNGPGTNSTSVTPTKKDPGRAETFQLTAAKNWTTEPTVLTQQWAIDVPQFQGYYHFIFPQADPLVVVGGQGFVIRVTSPSNVNCTAKISGVE